MNCFVDISFFKESFNSIVDHLSDVHKKPPFSCGECNSIFYSVKTAMEHGDKKLCPQASLKLNFTMINKESNLSRSRYYQEKKDMSIGFDSDSNLVNTFPSMVLSCDLVNDWEIRSPTLSVTDSTTSSLSGSGPQCESNGEKLEMLDVSEDIEEIRVTEMVNKKGSNLTNPDKEGITNLATKSTGRITNSISNSSKANQHANLESNKPPFLPHSSSINNLAAMLLQSRMAAFASLTPQLAPLVNRPDQRITSKILF